MPRAFPAQGTFVGFMIAMNITEIIRRRTSCRTFNGLHLDKSVVAGIQQEMEALPRLFDDVAAPVIRFVDHDNVEGRLGTYGFINGARQFLVMASGSSLREQVQAGFMFEALILKVTEMGFGTCWIGGTFRRGLFADAFGPLAEGMKISIVSPVGHPTPKRRLAERLMRRMVNEDHRKPFAELFRNVDADTPLGRIFRAVRLAPSSSNSQPWRAKVSTQKVAGQDCGEKSTIVSFNCKTSNRFSAIDMGIAYCHFLLASHEENIHWTIDPSSEPLALRFRSC